MATMALQQRLRARPAHTPGPTFLAYTPNGRKLITVGLNNAIRVFQSGSDAEPVTIDDCTDSNTAVDATNTFFVTGSEDGQVAKYSLESNSFEGLLFRSTLPVRDVALSPDGKWVAVASDELVVKVVNIEDMTRVITFNEQQRAVKHVSFDPTGSFLSVSCSDGRIYVYSFGNDEPELITTVTSVIKNLDTTAEESSRVIWHPDGRAFGAPTPGREVQVVSKDDWEKQRSFRNGHTGEITALAWSLNGALLATAGMDRKLVIWETRTQRPIHTYTDITATILDIQWHPTDNIISYTNIDGELFIRPDVVVSEHVSLLQETLQPAPFIHDPLADPNNNARSNGINGHQTRPAQLRRGSGASIDDILADAMSEDGYDDGVGFIDDDDGAGYAEQLNGNGKRTNGHLAPLTTENLKKRHTEAWKPQYHNSFQPGSTPWRGSRRYLCLNLTGAVWTVDQETHHSITVEFYDQDRRNFHFTDPFRYDKACLNDHGTLFSCQPSGTDAATIYYRPHETWTARTDWRTTLPEGEKVEAIALSDSFVVVTTSTNYVRVFTLFGVPFRVYRQKSSPTVTCAAWRDYVLTVGNGPVGADGRTRLQCTIENVKRDEVCQNEDTVALSEGADLNSVFFSDTGDPCIYDSTGVLLVLLHWRTPSQARWVPLLDTKLLSRTASGRKTESYWPVAVAAQRFYCIILKGSEQTPHLPVPLLSEFDFHMPVNPSISTSEADAEQDPDVQRQNLEETFVRSSLIHSLQSDLLANIHSTARQRTELAKAELEIDKALLQLLNIECRAGEEHGMKALEIVRLLRNSNGTMMAAAEKIAARFGRDVLGEKIREEVERREVGLDDED